MVATLAAFATRVKGSSGMYAFPLSEPRASASGLLHYSQHAHTEIAGARSVNWEVGVRGDCLGVRECMRFLYA
jgi:hypothetical protein